MPGLAGHGVARHGWKGAILAPADYFRSHGRHKRQGVPLRRELDAGYANTQKRIESREYCLVRLETDAGGPAGAPFARNHELIEEYVEPWLVGHDAFRCGF